MTEILRETHAGTLKIGDLRLPCAVLNNGARVISSTGFNEAFGQQQRTALTDGGSGPAELPRFLASKALNPYIGADFADTHKPIAYQPRQGGRAGIGYPVEIMTEAARAIIEAFEGGALRSTQRPLVSASHRLLIATSKVGLRALVDEACGYLPQPDDYRQALETEAAKPLKSIGNSARRPRSLGPLARQLGAAERQILIDALRKNNGHCSITAVRLGISRRALYDKMRAYGLDGEAASMRTEAGIMGPRRVEAEFIEEGSATYVKPMAPPRPVLRLMSPEQRLAREARIQGIEEDLRARMAVAVIAAKYSVPISTVYYRKKKLGLGRRRARRG